ncbi:MAG: thiamine pyrophosphate-dependent dehydrogenase E1 component subunit alpha [Chitinophagaceae bacterium]|nr:thiamine pyrophosphate-dependent dehydrogenase E1 component subunit alpha [Chitinophagaceae bacterium]
MNTVTQLTLYNKMVLLRHFDDMCRKLKMEDLIWSGYHPYTGQEAVAAGCCSQLKQDDCLLGNHRSHCHAVAKGTSVRAMLAEMMGRQSGVSGGLGGAMQFIHAENNLFCGSIVGSNIPLAAGMGMAFKDQQSHRVVMCMFGDGGSNTGSFHEGLNLAALWKLPVIYILENNQFAEAMPVAESVACSPLSKRARSYDLEEITVDGNDVVAVYNAVARAISKARAGEGTSLIEVLTYRIRGHYMGDPEETYRTKEEVDKWKEKDPIKLCRSQLLANGVAANELDEMESMIVKELHEDKSWVLQQPFATFEQAVRHVWIPLEQ